MPCCPLSGSPDVTLVERLDVHDIVTLFRTRMKVEIGNEFKGLTTIDYYKSNATGLYFFDPLITGSEGFMNSCKNSRSTILMNEVNFNTPLG